MSPFCDFAMMMMMVMDLMVTVMVVVSVIVIVIDTCWHMSVLCVEARLMGVTQLHALST